VLSPLLAGHEAHLRQITALIIEPPYP